MSDADSLHLTLLDGFEVSVGGTRTTIRGARSCQVLAFLALHCDATVSVDRLSDALWGGEQPTSARNSIQRFVSDLRRDLGPARVRIENAGTGYRLTLGDDDWCDALALEQMLPSARESLANGRPGDALTRLNERPSVIAEPFASVEGAAFAAAERHRFSELLADCGQVEVEARLAQGDCAGAVASARRLLEQHQYREHLCISLATGLTRMGRADEALRVLAAFRNRLVEDLGLDPSPTIGHTEMDILLHRDAEPLSSPVLAASDHLGAEMVEPSTLIGRDKAVMHATALLETKRLVTLTGASGIGKTALAEAVLRTWQREHGGDVRFVSLEEVAASGIAAAVGHVVGTSVEADLDPLGEVVDRVCAAVDLLVLDNCEHMTGDVAVFIDEIMAGSSSVRILATSRRPLGRVYEEVLPLEPLDRGASRDLLTRELERAGVELHSLDADSMVELLDEVDGLPLAIELAGAGLRSIGARDLLSLWRSDELPSRQFWERHRSTATAVRSTLRQLEAYELEVLGLCSLFPSDFTVEAVEALTGLPASEPLQNLVDHSLLEVERQPAATRYRMLVPIRSEIRALTEPYSPVNRQAFVDYFEQLALACLDQMKGVESASGVAVLRAELSSIAAAFDFSAADGRVSQMASIVECVGLANAMSPSVGAKSHLRDWGDRLRAQCPAPSTRSVSSDAVQTALAWGLYGSNDGAWYQLWESESLPDDVETQAMAAIARFSRGESAAAWDLLRDLDLQAATDIYVRSMLCGIGAVIAYEVGANGDDLCEAAVAAALERPSHGAAFFAGLARSSRAFVGGDVSSCVEILEDAVGAIDGHGLVTLENMGLAAVAMTVGLLIGERDPSSLIVGLIDRYLDQHSLDPASVAMALDVAVIHLDRSGLTEAAATLLGLLDRFGLSMAILRGLRSNLETKLAGNPAWTQARAVGFTQPAFAVLRASRAALLDASQRQSAALDSAQRRPASA